MDSMMIDKWRNLKLEDFYHPRYQSYLRWFMDVTFVLSCLFYSFTAYTIITKSPKQMGAFKYTVLTQISFNMLYKIAMFLFNPVIHFPLPIISADGYFQFGEDWIVPLLGVAFLAIIAAGIAILFSVINRVLAAFDTKSAKSSTVKFSVGIAAFVVICAILWGSVMAPLFMLRPKLESSWQSLEATIPALIQLRKLLPSTFGIHPAQTGNLLTLFIAIAAGWTFIYTVAFITLNIIVLYQLKKIKKVVSKTTYSMHKMLHTALIVQTINLILFAIIPICILVITFLLQLSYGSWISNLAVPISSIHLIVDAPSLLYFIKPYRKFVLQVILRKNANVSRVEAFSMIQRQNGNPKSRSLSIVENLVNRNYGKNESYRGGNSGSF